MNKTGDIFFLKKIPFLPFPSNLLKNKWGLLSCSFPSTFRVRYTTPGAVKRRFFKKKKKNKKIKKISTCTRAEEYNNTNKYQLFKSINVLTN